MIGKDDTGNLFLYDMKNAPITINNEDLTIFTICSSKLSSHGTAVFAQLCNDGNYNYSCKFPQSCIFQCNDHFNCPRWRRALNIKKLQCCNIWLDNVTIILEIGGYHNINKDIYPQDW